MKQGAEVYAHDFARSCVNMNNGEPYWRDVGTIDAYWEANIDLTHVTPELNLYDTNWPIWTYQEQMPPAKFVFDDDRLPRHGDRFDRLGRLHRERLDGAALAALLQRARAQPQHDRGFGDPARRRDRPLRGGDATP